MFWKFSALDFFLLDFFHDFSELTFWLSDFLLRLCECVCVCAFLCNCAWVCECFCKFREKKSSLQSLIPWISLKRQLTVVLLLPWVVCLSEKKTRGLGDLLKPRKLFFFYLGRKRAKSLDIVKKKTLLLKSNKRNLSHRKVASHHIEQFVCGRFSL